VARSCGGRFQFVFVVLPFALALAPRWEPTVTVMMVPSAGGTYSGCRRKRSHVRRIRKIAHLVTFHYSPRRNHPAADDPHPARVPAQGHFRLGKLLDTKGPGLIFLIPIVKNHARAELMEAQTPIVT
jgi:hypothetical protein